VQRQFGGARRALHQPRQGRGPSQLRLFFKVKRHVLPWWCIVQRRYRAAQVLNTAVRASAMG